MHLSKYKIFNYHLEKVSRQQCPSYILGSNRGSGPFPVFDILKSNCSVFLHRRSRTYKSHPPFHPQFWETRESPSVFLSYR